MAEHRKRWQEVCDKLSNPKVQIIFAPVNQEFKIKPKMVDEKHCYDQNGFSIIKTHRMMFLMGCNNLKTIGDL